MAGIRRKKKSATFSPQEMAERKQRVSKLMEIVAAYDREVGEQASSPKGKNNFSTFERHFREALSWSEQHFLNLRIDKQNNPFADPLLVAEYLVTHNADRETLCAAMLYPVASPTEHGDPANIEILRSIKRTFGDKVERLVGRTIKLASLEKYDLKEGATQTREEHIRQFQMLAMNITEDPRAFLIRGANRYIKINSADNRAETNGEASFGRRNDNYTLDETETVIAPIAYRIGYGKLRYDLLDLVYKRKYPADYNHAQRRLSYIKGVWISEADLTETADTVAHFITEELGIPRDMFRVSGRRKTIVSALQKRGEKQHSVENQGDRLALRVTLNANIDNEKDFNPNKLSAKERNDLLAKLAKLCFKICGSETENGLIKKFGFYTEDPQLKMAFKKSRFHDDYFDDYISSPKPNGYEALHLQVFIEIKGKYVPFEIQIDDELRREFNENGPRAHSVYKTKLSGEEVDDWMHNATQVMSGGESDLGFIYVWNEKNEIIHLKRGATVRDFALAANISVRKGNIEATIANDNPLIASRPDAVYGINHKLTTGDRVKLAA